MQTASRTSSAVHAANSLVNGRSAQHDAAAKGLAETVTALIATGAAVLAIGRAL